MLPPFVAAIAPETGALIEERLQGIAAQEGARILFAIESGSRAWGFPSPDSDYDVRFVYARDPDWYLSLEPGRDVIERPIEDELDIAGWDIRKALSLLLKPNPVLLEWLSSPVRYRWSPAADRLAELARGVAPATACLHHYLHLGEGQWRRHVGDGPKVSYKKYFYVLRPALAIRWVRLNPELAPPMNLQQMAAGLDLDPAVEADIARLLALKAETRELGKGARIDRLDHLIEAEFTSARQAPPRPRSPDRRADAEALFREIVKDAIE